MLYDFWCNRYHRYHGDWSGGVIAIIILYSGSLYRIASSVRCCLVRDATKRQSADAPAGGSIPPNALRQHQVADYDQLRQLKSPTTLPVFPYMLPRLRLTAHHLHLTSIATSLRATAAAAMSTFTLPHSHPEVSVHLTSDLEKDQLLSFPAFKTWLSTLQHSLALQKNESHTFHSSPYQLRKIDVQSVDFFGGGRLGFVKLKAEISNDHGESLPGSVFLRGGSVGMMVC